MFYKSGRIGNEPIMACKIRNCGTAVTDGTEEQPDHKVGVYM